MGTRYVGLGKENVFGTPVAAARYESCTDQFEPDQGWIIPEPVAAPAYDKKQLGPYRARGVLPAFPVTPLGIVGELLYGVLGNVNSAQQGGTAAYLHTFSRGTSLPSFTARLGVELKERIDAGVLFNSLEFHFEQGKAVTVQPELFSGFVESDGNIGAPTIDTLEALSMFESTATATIAAADVRKLLYDVTIKIENNIPFDRGDLNGRGWTTKRYGLPKVTGKLSTYFESATEYERFLAGGEFALAISTSGPLISGSYRYGLGFQLPRCVYTKGVPHVASQSEQLVVDAPFQAFYSTGSGFNDVVKATLTNTVTGY